MLDSDSLHPVIVAMSLYLVLSVAVPRIITKPTNIKIVDDEIMYLMAQKGSMLSGVILIGIIVYLTNYFMQQGSD